MEYKIGIGQRILSVENAKPAQVPPQTIEQKLYSDFMAISQNIAFKETIRRIDALNAKMDFELAIFYEVTPSCIPREKRELAKWTAAQVARIFKIESPEVKWFSKETKEEKIIRHENGEPPFESITTSADTIGLFEKAYPNQIWIRSDLQGQELIEVVCHEVCHAAGLNDEETTRACARELASIVNG